MASLAELGLSARMTPRLGMKPGPHRARSIRLPGGRRVIFTDDPGEGFQLAGEQFATRLRAIVRDPHGRLVEEHDLGSGLITNVGMACLANDGLWAAPAGVSLATLASCKWHAWGTSETAATTSDVALNALAAPTTANAVAGVTTLLSAANSQTHINTATITAGSTLKITEWGIHSAQVLSATTGTPLTAAAATSATVTATPYTASTAELQGEQQLIIKAGTTAVWGLITKNSTSVLTLPAWYKTSDGTVGATPGNTEAFTLLPVMLDHRVFGVITVETGNTITFPWELLCKSGG